MRIINLDFEYPFIEKINPCWAAARDIHGGYVFMTECWDETNRYWGKIPNYNNKPKYKKKRIIKVL